MNASGRTCSFTWRPAPRYIARAHSRRGQHAVREDYEEVNKVFLDLRADFQVQGEDVSVSSGAAGRGLFFIRDCEQHTTVQIPLHNTLLITDDPMGGPSIIGQLHLDEFQKIHGEMHPLLHDFLLGEARWEVRMCAWLLWIMKHEASSDSPWANYLASLPELDELSSMLSYSPVEQRCLTIPKYIREAEIQRDVAEIFHYQYFYGLKADLGDLRLSSDVNTTIWAMALVRSRSFGHIVEGEEISIMAPYLDIANHSPTYNSSFRTSKDGEYFELYTFQDCVRGEELSISYGTQKRNIDLMRDYGFVLQGSSWFTDRIHFVYECQCLLRDQGVPEGAEEAAKLIQITRSCFMDEVEDGPNAGQVVRRRDERATALSLNLLGTALQQYTPAGIHSCAYLRAALMSIDPLMQECMDDHPDDLTAETGNLNSSYSGDTSINSKGTTAHQSAQEELATGLQTLCSNLLQTYRGRKRAVLPNNDVSISPHRQHAADLAFHEHCRVVVGIHRILELYKRALLEHCS